MKFLRRLFLKNTSGRVLLTIFAKSSILDVWQGIGPKYAASGNENDWFLF